MQAKGIDVAIIIMFAAFFFIKKWLFQWFRPFFFISYAGQGDRCPHINYAWGDPRGACLGFFAINIIMFAAFFFNLKMSFLMISAFFFKKKFFLI